MPGLFDPRATTAVTESLRHESLVTVNGTQVDVESASLTFDESQSPHVTFEATCRTPETQSVLDALDPRTFPRVRVSLGYRYPGGQLDLPELVNLSLSSRTVTRPDNQMRVYAESDEVIVGETGRTTDWNFGATFNPAAVVRDLLQAGSPGSTVLLEASRPSVTEDEALIVRGGDDLMAAAAEIADRGADLWVYDDGTRTFHIAERPRLGSVAAALQVGANGTIIRSETTMARDQWANAVLVRHTWTTSSGTEAIRTGYAQTTSGPYAVATVGRKMLVIDRRRPASAASAKAAAASVLKRVLSRGRSFDLDAHAAYWLRPGHTVTVQLPAGEQERHLVSRVRFDIPTGRMSVATRLPQDAVIE